MALYHRLINFKNTLKRKHPYSEDEVPQNRFRRYTRCLTRWDLTNLGLGNTLGIGVYVLVGAVAVRVAGPSIVLSFLIAAVTSLLAGLCYAEFGSRVSKAGSVYMYTYVTIGEFLAFMIGWNLILEAVFGTASIAKGMSTYFDALMGGDMYEFFMDTGPIVIKHPYLSTFFDMFAFFTVLIFGFLLTFGVRQSVMVTNVCAIINLVIILFIIITGATQADPKNWSLELHEIVDIEFDAGNGGFFPYGLWGTFKGAAVCFYGFAGFDIISSTGEEVVSDPRHIIPQAIMTVLGVALLVYLALATVVTLMVPYYLLDKVAAIATAFTHMDMDWARHIVALGGTVGIYSSLFASMFLLPRLIYSMAVDRLMPPCFSYIHPKKKTAMLAILIPASVIAIIASIMDMEHMILIMCVGTLFSYTVVGACVIVLRYRSKDVTVQPGFLKQLFGCGSRTPCRMSSRCANFTLTMFIITSIATGLILNHVTSYMFPIIGLHGLMIVWLVIMTVQPQEKAHLPPFKIPFVPLIPLLSIYANINLMIFLDVYTWILVLVWVSVGIVIYLIFACAVSKDGRSHFRTQQVISHRNLDDKDSSLHDVKEKDESNLKHNLTKDSLDLNLTLRPSQDKMHKENPMEEPEAIDKQKEKFDTKENTIALDIVTIENDLQQKEAKIIDLLDQVLQAEEDNYIEIVSFKEENIEDKHMVPIPIIIEPIPHTKSFSDLSDAGSDASFGNQVLSKYDVIVQVHREDLPKVHEDIEKEANIIENDETEEHEDMTVFNDSETNSRTDESGYSDTIDKSALNDSTEDARDDIPYIPEPPPLDENYFTRPYFKKSYTIPSRPKKVSPAESEEDTKPRESVQSNTSQDDGTIVFGSDRQMNFMSKLTVIFQNKIDRKEEDYLKRSNSTGNVKGVVNVIIRERPAIIQDLNKEILAVHSTPNLRPVNADVKEQTDTEDVDNDSTMSREDLKSKLENIFSTGGPKPLKPRLMKSNPPTPEEAYQTDTSSAESIPKLPKIEKNDTLKRQKDKFGEVLNSFRLSLNREDVV